MNPQAHLMEIIVELRNTISQHDQEKKELMLKHKEELASLRQNQSSPPETISRSTKKSTI